MSNNVHNYNAGVCKAEIVHPAFLLRDKIEIYARDVEEYLV